MTRKATLILSLALAGAGVAAVAAQQYPVMDMMASHLIQKYQTASCEQLWQERAQGQSHQKTPQQQEAITLLKGNPQMRAAFIDKVAAPIANKLFDCGMIP